jgi:hypothetical protein
MTAWIFQGNPTWFDIDGYLAVAPGRIIWLVTKLKEKMQKGDQIFIWRAKGRSKDGNPGIVAECIVDSEVREMPEDPLALKFWIGPFDPTPKSRVWLKVVRVAENNDILKRGMLLKDPVLKEVSPIRVNTGTNFKLEPAASRRLNELWSDTRVRSQEQTRQELDVQATSLQTKSLEVLLDKYTCGLHSPSSVDLPRQSKVETTIFDRCPLVIAIARVRASFRCEVPKCATPSFLTESNEYYCEVHHLVPLAQKGLDRIENVACVCANHHRELHLGKRGAELTEILRTLRQL